MQLNHLEERRGSRTRSPRSSYASTTTSSGTLTSGGDGRVSSTADLSPDSIQDHCLPVDVVVVEAEMKGTLLERLVLLENRVLKVYTYVSLYPYLLIYRKRYFGVFPPIKQVVDYRLFVLSLFPFFFKLLFLRQPFMYYWFDFVSTKHFDFNPIFFGEISKKKFKS